jgi:CheY-like chemotaxis protein
MPSFEPPPFVLADRVRLKQVLINLLSNAIKYNRPGGTITVDWTTTLDRTRISVRDTGIGLAPEQLAQLFQPFNRLGKENSSEQGTGIGLVMGKLLVELMGGVIGVESTAGVGSVFWFELCSAAAPLLAAAIGGPPVPALGHVAQVAPARTLLYVEDNTANLALVEQIIARRPDLRLLSAGTGRLGIELARAHRPEVILMDINLPDMNGLEALKILQGDPRTAHIPVLAISANAMLGDIQKCLEAGFFQYLTKPIRVDAFTEALDGAMALPGGHPVRTGKES